ncbi:MAG: type I-E CRISPR-associated protein Cse1/CasA, partial [Corynebacterium urealyticum]
MSQHPQISPSFDLLDEPWIICTTNNGPATLSIREIFDGSATPVAVLGDSPTQDYALLRLLLAIFWRAHHQSVTKQLSTRAGRRSFRWEDWFVDKRQAL